MANKLMLIQAIAYLRFLSYRRGLLADIHHEDAQACVLKGDTAGYEDNYNTAFKLLGLQKRAITAANILTLLLIAPSVQPTTRPAATPSAVLSVDVASLPRPVVYGGDLTLALGLAESLALLNWYQMTAAAHGVDWLAEQQEGGDNG